jgi:hypothetical protein
MMTDQEINEAIAKACGWEKVREEEYPHRWLWRKGEVGSALFDEPDNYCADLNAMHEAVMAQPLRVAAAVCGELMKMLNPAESYILHRSINATARQRAEAFLRALRKWKEA